MVSTSHFKKGLKILVKDQPYTILDFQHVKPGKGNQFTRTKLKHLVTGAYRDLTVRSGEKFNVPDVVYKDMSFLYKDSEGFHFMDTQSYEQSVLSESALSGAVHFLKENLEVKVCFFKGQAAGVQLPKTVTLKITDTTPGHKGNTVTGATKAARVQTGHSLQVPLHLKTGDRVKINTSDGSYMERVKDGDSSGD